METVRLAPACLALTALVAAAPTARAGDVLNVGPGQPYATIQAAIDAAAPGDLVLVDPGSYPEFRLAGKGLSIVASGSDFTVLESTSAEPAILVENVPADHEVTIVGAEVRHAISFDTPAVLVRSNPGSVRFSALEVHLDDHLIGTSATAAVRIENTDTFHVIDSLVWTSTPKQGWHITPLGEYWEAVSALEVEESDGVVQNCNLVGYDAFQTWAGDGLRVIGNASVWLVDDFVDSPQSSILRGGDGVMGGSAIHLLGDPKKTGRITLCGSVKLQKGSGSSQTGGRYAVNGDGGIINNPSFPTERLPKACRNYEYVETSAGSATAPIGQPIQLFYFDVVGRPYMTLMTSRSHYARNLLNIGNRALADPAAPIVRVVSTGMLPQSQRYSVQVPVPNDPNLIGLQLTFQTLSGTLYSQNDSLSFPALVVVTP